LQERTNQRFVENQANGTKRRTHQVNDPGQRGKKRGGISYLKEEKEKPS